MQNRHENIIGWWGSCLFLWEEMRCPFMKIVFVLGTQFGDAPPGLGMMGVPGGPPPPGGPWGNNQLSEHEFSSTCMRENCSRFGQICTHHVVSWRWGGVCYLQGEINRMGSKAQRMLNGNTYRLHYTLTQHACNNRYNCELRQWSVPLYWLCEGGTVVTSILW